MSKPKPRILITEPIPESVIKYLSEFGEVTVGEKGRYLDEKHLISDIASFDGLLSMLSNPVTARVLEAATHLKIVANFAVGYNNIDINMAANLGIKVANTPNVLTEACGDFAMALLMATSRNFYQAEKYLREGGFKGWEPLGFLGPELRGRKLGIIGMGRIGQAFAKRAIAFGMDIQYCNRRPLPQHIENELDATYIPDINQIASSSDVLSLNCPLTPETHHLVNKELLHLMPKHALLINISRGPVVDEAALAHALHNGIIFGAGLDVFEEEPTVHPDLLSAPNCTILPHIASATYETRKAIGMLAADAIIKVLSGEPDTSIMNLIS